MILPPFQHMVQAAAEVPAASAAFRNSSGHNPVSFLQMKMNIIYGYIIYSLNVIVN